MPTPTPPASEVESPPLAEVLDRLDARLATIERALETLHEGAHAATQTAATLTDIADHAAARAADEGIDLDARLRANLRLIERLSAPETTARLERMLARLEHVEPALDALEQAPALVATTTDILDGWARRLGDAGVDVEDRARRIGALVSGLSAPETLELFEALMARREHLMQALKMSQELPNMLAVVTDIIDHAIARAADQGIDVGALGTNSVDAAARLMRLLQGDEFEALMRSGVFEASTLQVISRAAQALRDVQQERPERMGLLRAVRQGGDPNIQRALGFAVRFGKRFGQLLQPQLDG